MIENYKIMKMNELMSCDEIKSLTNRYYKCMNKGQIEYIVYCRRIQIDGVYVTGFGSIIYINNEYGNVTNSADHYFDFGVWHYNYDYDMYGKDVPIDKRHYYIRENISEITKENALDYVSKAFEQINKNMDF